MKKMLSLLSALPLALTGCATLRPAPLPMGAPAPGFALHTTDGDSISAPGYAGRTLALIFIDPTCPDVQNATERKGFLRRLETAYRDDRKVAFLYIASTPPEHDSYLRPGDLQAWLKEQRLGNPLALDTTGTLASAYRVERVPAAAVIDPDGLLRYNGPADALTDSGSLALHEAIQAAPNRRNTAAPQAPNTGCPQPHRTPKP